MMARSLFQIVFGIRSDGTSAYDGGATNDHTSARFAPCHGL